jgi:hypothetical protein
MNPLSEPAVVLELANPIYELIINFEDEFCVAPPTKANPVPEPTATFVAVLFAPEN